MSSCNDQSLANLDEDCDVKLFGMYFFCKPKEGGDAEPLPADTNYYYDDEPQDVEGCFYNNEYYVVQTRPQVWLEKIIKWLNVSREGIEVTRFIGIFSIEALVREESTMSQFINFTPE